MSTVAEVVRNALVILNVADAYQPIKAVDMADGIAAMNRMVRRWEANGTTLGWTPVENPTDEMPIPDECEDAVIYNLAIRLRARYQVSIEPDVIELARAGYAALLRDVKVASPLTFEQEGNHYDIRTDSYVS